MYLLLAASAFAEATPRGRDRNYAPAVLKTVLNEQFFWRRAVLTGNARVCSGLCSESVKLQKHFEMFQGAERQDRHLWRESPRASFRA